MRRSSVVATVVGLGVLVTGPALAAASAFPTTTVESPGAETEVRAALDMFLDLGPVKGESRDR